MHYIPYVAKYWWGKILANLVNCSHVAKINPTKILPMNTEFIAPAIIISCEHGRLVEILLIPFLTAMEEEFLSLFHREEYHHHRQHPIST